MENILFLETYLSIVQKAKSCTRVEAVKYTLEPISTVIVQPVDLPMAELRGLYETFLKPDALAELNVSASLITEMENCLKSDATTVPLVYLAKLRTEVVAMVYENTYRNWIAHIRSTLSETSKINSIVEVTTGSKSSMGSSGIQPEAVRTRNVGSSILSSTRSAERLC